MSAIEDELAAAETAYRRSMFKMIFHLGFVLVCCFLAVALRKALGLPPALLSVVLIIALLLFSPEIFRFLVLRNRVQILRKEAGY